MDKIVALSMIAFLLAVGFTRVLREVLRGEEKIKDISNFLNKFGKYVQSQGSDYEAYLWLIQKSPKIQAMLGGYGEASLFRPPFANFAYRDYQIIVNVIPEIRKEFEDDAYLRNTRALNEYIALVRDSLLRFVGVLNDELETKKKKLKNPVIWFSEGVSWLLLLPFSLVQWVGLLSERLVNGIANHVLFKIMAGLASLLGVISTLMTIMLGWGAFLSAIQNLLTP